MTRCPPAVLLVCLVVAACGDAPGSKGDPERGARVHEVCLDCHGTGIYLPPQRKIKSLEALHLDVKRWGDYYAPALTEQDVEDVTAYLNRDYYKF